LAILWFHLFIKLIALHKFMLEKLKKTSLYIFQRRSLKILGIKYLSQWRCHRIIKIHKETSSISEWHSVHQKNIFQGRTTNWWLISRLKEWKRVTWWLFLIWKRVASNKMILKSTPNDQKSSHKISFRLHLMIIKKKKPCERQVLRKKLYSPGHNLHNLKST